MKQVELLPEVFLEEFKYVVKEENIRKYIIADKEISSDSNNKNSDEENSNEENLINSNITTETFFINCFCIYKNGK